jgi:hypothetical protein
MISICSPTFLVACTLPARILDINASIDIVPESSNGCVLVTSRSRKAAYEMIGDYESIISIEPMTEASALALFRKKFKDESSDADIQELMQSLDYMPLAISQATAYIRQRTPRMTVSKYLKDLKQGERDKASLLNTTVRDRRRDGKASNSILATWQMSFEHIQKMQQSAAKLLSLMSFFDRQGIPEDLVNSRYEEDSILNFNEDIEMLRNYSLIIVGNEEVVGRA